MQLNITKPMQGTVSQILAAYVQQLRLYNNSEAYFEWSDIFNNHSSPTAYSTGARLSYS